MMLALSYCHPHLKHKSAGLSLCTDMSVCLNICVCLHMSVCFCRLVCLLVSGDSPSIPRGFQDQLLVLPCKIVLNPRNGAEDKRKLSGMGGDKDSEFLTRDVDQNQSHFFSGT